MAFKTKVVLVVLLVALLIGVPPGLGQQSPEVSREDLYSIWIKLSMMGHNQSEIEGNSCRNYRATAAAPQKPIKA